MAAIDPYAATVRTNESLFFSRRHADGRPAKLAAQILRNALAEMAGRGGAS